MSWTLALGLCAAIGAEPPRAMFGWQGAVSDRVLLWLSGSQVRAFGLDGKDRQGTWTRSGPMPVYCTSVTVATDIGRGKVRVLIGPKTGVHHSLLIVLDDSKHEGWDEYEVTIYVTAKRQKRAVKASRRTPQRTTRREPPKPSHPTDRPYIREWVRIPSAFGNYIDHKGVVVNPTKAVTGSLEVKIYALDEHDNLVDFDSAYCEPDRLGPGQRATFHVMMRRSPRAKKYRAEVQQ